MPFGHSCEFLDFDACVAKQVADGKNEEGARKICGALMRDTEEKCRRKAESKDAMGKQIEPGDQVLGEDGEEYAVEDTGLGDEEPLVKLVGVEDLIPAVDLALVEKASEIEFVVPVVEAPDRLLGVRHFSDHGGYQIARVETESSHDMNERVVVERAFDPEGVLFLFADDPTPRRPTEVPE